MRLTANDVALLRRVDKSTWDDFVGDVTWRDEYRRKGSIITYRLWDSERDYTVVTSRVKRLLGMGLVAHERGFSGGHGGLLILTDAGKAALRGTDKEERE